MIDFKIFHEVIRERIENPNAFYYAVPWWKKEIDVFSENLQVTIAFIETECSDEELYWFGEVLEDIVELTQSRELWKAFSKRANLVKNEEIKKSVMEDLVNSEAYLTNN
ncbi:MAG: hypothetical protein Q4D21_07440 [Phascolarctobacterium sp.]|nr:hypothetical protein [Phascolarctobacterium sp.]